jgi:molecular chaperone GrpE
VIVKEEEKQSKNEDPLSEESPDGETTTSKDEVSQPDETMADEVGEVSKDDERADEEPLSLEERLEAVQAQADEYLDGWQRARAEFVNYKKRVDRERKDSRARIAAELLTRYLDVLDDLDRTLTEMPDEIGDTSWSQGLKMVYQKMQLILESEGVQTIEGLGESFDPNFHEAIAFEESEEYEEGQVVAVVQKGYLLGERVLRPAMVRVAK